MSQRHVGDAATVATPQPRAPNPAAPNPALPNLARPIPAAPGPAVVSPDRSTPARASRRRSPEPDAPNRSVPGRPGADPPDRPGGRAADHRAGVGARPPPASAQEQRCQPPMRGRTALVLMIGLLAVAGVKLVMVQTVEASAYAAKGEQQRTVRSPSTPNAARSPTATARCSPSPSRASARRPTRPVPVRCATPPGRGDGARRGQGHRRVRGGRADHRAHVLERGAPVVREGEVVVELRHAWRGRRAPDRRT